MQNAQHDTGTRQEHSTYLGYITNVFIIVYTLTLLKSLKFP